MGRYSLYENLEDGDDYDDNDQYDYYDLVRKEDQAPVKHLCYCPKENFRFNGVWCKCGGL